MTPAEQRKAWARRYIAAAPGAPVYGSDAWAAMPHGPAKVAAVVKAAEAWLTEQEDELERLRVEHLAAAVEQKRDEDADWLAQVAAHRTNWDGRRGGFRRPDPAIAPDVEREWVEWVRGEAS